MRLPAKEAIVSGDHGPLGESPWSKGVWHTGGYDAPQSTSAQSETATAYGSVPRDETPSEVRYFRPSPASAPSFNWVKHAPVLLLLGFWYATYATVRSMYAVLSPAAASDGEMMMMASPASLIGLLVGPAYTLVCLQWLARSGQPLWPWFKTTIRRLIVLTALLFAVWVVWRTHWAPTFNAWLDEFRARLSSQQATPAQPRRATPTPRDRRPRRPAHNKAAATSPTHR